MLAPGEGAGRQGRWKVVHVTSRIVASAPEVTGLFSGAVGWGRGECLVKTEPAGEAVQSCPCCKFPVPQSGLGGSLAPLSASSGQLARPSTVLRPQWLEPGPPTLAGTLRGEAAV